MTSYFGLAARKFVRFIPVKAVLILLGLSVFLSGGASTKAFLGTIHGRVTATGGAALPNTQIHFFDLNGNGDSEAAIATTDALGDYSANLPPSVYAFFTQNTLGYINKIYDNIPCSAGGCDADLLTPVVVSNGSDTTANFVLDPGGRIAGRVTDSATGQGIPGVTVFFIPESGEIFFTSAVTNTNGDYISDGGTAAGNAFAITANNLGYFNEIWPNTRCSLDSCDPGSGTVFPVTGTGTTGGINFVLDQGARITGTVRDINNAPLALVDMNIMDSTGSSVEGGNTDASGNYVSGGLAAGTYYVMTENPYGLVDKIWNGIPCGNGNCDPRTLGTPIVVTALGTASNINFVLPPGGRISGTVTHAVGGGPIGAGVFVGLSDPSGTYVGGANLDSTETQYTIRGLPPGTYYANIFSPPGFFNQMYNNLTCTTNCNILQSTPIHVTAGATTANINFPLVPTTQVGTISGTIRDITGGAPGVVVSNLPVQLFNATGAQIAQVNTNASGVYTFPNLAVATYYLRTAGSGALINQMYSSGFCSLCNPVTSGGTPIPVTAGGTATADLNLTSGGRISGTVTNFVGGAGINPLTVNVYNTAGVNVASGQTSGTGAYTTRALPDGTYYLKTINTLGFVDKLYDNAFCPGGGCPVVTGTPVVVAGTGTVGGKNFVLSTGGRISGNVAGPGTPNFPTIQFGTNVQIYNDTGVFLGSSTLDGSLNYTSFALPAGRYYARTANSLGLIDQLYSGVACSPSCTITGGTPIDVVAGATTGGKNFTLTIGGNIAGTVRDQGTTSPIAQVRVTAFQADGSPAKAGATNANGEYSIIGLPPGTYYLRTSIVNGPFYADELYNELPCPLTCTVTTGEPVVVTAGVTENGKNFTLSPGGGALSGTIKNAATNSFLSGIQVQVFLPDGTLVKQVSTNGAGAFSMTLPAGTYRARTNVGSSGDYLDELFNNGPCTPTCNVASGASIVVADGATNNTVDFTLSPNLVHNGKFDGGLVSWTLFSTPDLSYIVSQLTNGVFEYYRVPPPPGTANQAVIFEWTGVPLAANAPVIARFSLGNSSSVRKRISVLVLDSDFSDLSVCTFWLAPNTPLANYEMRTHSTKAWANTAIYFYAASAGSNGGFYQLDNVSIESVPTESATRTLCVDPTTPPAPGGADSAEFLVNGNFNTGVIDPWFTFGQISGQVTGGVFEFIKLAGTPAGVVSQFTGQTPAAGSILTATFQLGNSSTVRKRVTVILGDSNFGDLSACTFWLPPSTPLSNYAYRTFATQAWANAAISVYPATTGPDQWIRLDNVSMKKTPGTTIVGTECLEPGSAWAPEAGSLVGTPASAAVGSSGDTVSHDGWRADGFMPAGDGAGSAWTAVAAGDGPYILQRAKAIDLSDATNATLTFKSWLTGVSRGEVQVRGSGGEWTTVLTVDATDAWAPMSVDLSAYLGQVIELRFVYFPVAGSSFAMSDTWRLDGIAIETGRTSMKHSPPR
jgi:hypothetical protein